MGFMYIDSKGVVHAVQAIEVAEKNAVSFIREVPSPYITDMGDIWFLDESDRKVRIDGELPYTEAAGVTWDDQQIKGNIRNHPVLMDLVKQIISE